MLLALVTFLLTAADPASTYLWPLNLPQVVTSSFGEYRGGRFHAGLDLRTGGIGKEVRAPVGGCVSRVRCSPWGYGKAVYLSLDDGNTAVFGHLSDFAPTLRDYLRQAQHNAKCYTVDLEPPASRFRFEAGDLLAYSGDTGIGPAHLHYELRDKAGRPFNPRKVGVCWPDTTTPRLQKIVVAPDGPGSLVNGDVKPVVVSCRSAGGAYVCDTVKASGRIGIGVDLLDPANNGENKLGVYSVKTTANGREIFAIRFDGFSYEESRHEAVAYHPFLKDLGAFLLQWRWPGNGCGIFAHPADGWIQVGEKPVEVCVEAEDFLGNKSSVTFTVQPQPVPAEPVVPVTPDSLGSGSVELDCAGQYLIVTARFPNPEPVTPILHAEGAVHPSDFRRIGQKTFRAAVAPAPDAETITITTGHPRLEAAPYVIHVFHHGTPARNVAAGDAVITVMSASPYGIMFLRTETGDSAEGIRVLRLWPGQMPIDEPLALSMPVPAGNSPDRLAVYRRGKSKWERLPTRREGGRLIASVSEFGDFAALEDTAPPVISDIAIGAAGLRPAISANVTDDLSGIARVDITCNGQWLLAAYDPEANTVTWERDQDLPPPPWELAVIATDQAGNQNTVSTKRSQLPQ